MATRGRLAALPLLANLSLSAQSASGSAQTLLGQGWGIDHVGVGVRVLDEAQHGYEQLGFKVGKGGHFPGGISNSIVSLQNNSYLKLLSVSCNTRITQGDASYIADFVKKHEGAMFLGIHVSSAKAAVDYLQARSFDVNGPNPGSIMKEGETTPPPPMWYRVSSADKPAAGKQSFTLPMFLIEYVYAGWGEKSRTEGLMEHPNTAMGIHAVWYAVHDAKAQSRALRNAGLGESREAKCLGTHGREGNAGQGVLLLLDSSKKDGLLARYLPDPVGLKSTCNCPSDERIIGISIEVSNLSKARQLAESGTGRKSETYEGFYGPSFVLPPEVTHGLWMEMFQSAEPLH